MVETDGELEDAYFTPQFVELIDAAVWGQGFPAPVFSGEFDVASQALVKDKHLKLQLRARTPALQRDLVQSHRYAAGAHRRWPTGWSSDTWNGVARVQLIVEHAAS